MLILTSFNHEKFYLIYSRSRSGSCHWWMRACLFRLSKTLLSVPAAKRLIALADRAVLVALMGIIIFRMPPVVLWEITFIAREV